MRITGALLREHGACCEWAKFFMDMWPDGANITIKNVRKAMQLGFSLKWFVDAFCDSSEWRRFTEHLRKVEAACTRLTEAAYAPWNCKYRALCARFASSRLFNSAEYGELCLEADVITDSLDRKLAQVRKQGQLVAFMLATQRFQSPRTRAAVNRLVKATRSRKWH